MKWTIDLFAWSRWQLKVCFRLTTFNKPAKSVSDLLRREERKNKLNWMAKFVWLMFRFKEEWAIFSFPYSSILSSLKTHLLYHIYTHLQIYSTFQKDFMKKICFAVYFILSQLHQFYNESAICNVLARNLHYSIPSNFILHKTLIERRKLKKKCSYNSFLHTWFSPFARHSYSF